MAARFLMPIRPATYVLNDLRFPNGYTLVFLPGTEDGPYLYGYHTNFGGPHFPYGLVVEPDGPV